MRDLTSPRRVNSSEIQNGYHREQSLSIAAEKFNTPICTAFSVATGARRSSSFNRRRSSRGIAKVSACFGHGRAAVAPADRPCQLTSAR
jgi:hypothetical protein